MSYLTLFDYVAFVSGLLILGVWFFLYFKGKKYENLFLNLDNKDYPAGDTYFVGYAATLLLKMDYKNRQARKLRKELSVLYEPKYADYYLRVIASMQFTMALTIAGFAAPMYFLSGSVALFLVLLLGSGAVYYYYGVSTEEKLKKRADEMILDFSEVVSKLALLVNSGMILTDAWKKVAYSGDHVLYSEMQKSIMEMQNGKSASDAIYSFGQRSLIPEVKKFSSTLIQGLAQGNSELAPMLTQQSSEVWNLKKQLVRRQGELANNKLLIPMCTTFIGILIMVTVPIFANLGA